MNRLGHQPATEPDQTPGSIAPVGSAEVEAEKSTCGNSGHDGVPRVDEEPKLFASALPATVVPSG